MNTSRPSAHRALWALLAVSMLGVLSPESAYAQVSGQYVGRLGFTDPKHTRADGFQSSTVTAISDAGYTVGFSQRFASTSNSDQSAWMGSPQGGTKSIGFYDAAHKASIGRHFSRVVKLSRSGRAIGLSARFDGGAFQTGRTAWLASWGGGTRRIGLYFDSPSPVAGALYNNVLDLNEAGHSIGTTWFSDGRHAWVADVLGNTRAIGLMDDAHMSPGRAPYNTPVALNASGTVIGDTVWSGGQAAWLQSKNPGVPSQRIGIYDAAHTFTDGQVRNVAVALNDHGYAVGYATREQVEEYGTYHFNDAWVRTPAGETVQITAGVPLMITHSNLVGGYEDFDYNWGYPWVYDIEAGTLRYLFGNDGGGSGAYIAFLSEDGVVVGGSSGVFTPSSSRWLAPAGKPPVRIGIYDLEHDGGSGKSVFSSWIAGTAKNGLTVGVSEQMRAEGQTAWIASPITGQTYRIGLYGGIYDGAVHVEDLGDGNSRSFTSHTSEPTHVTSTRFAAGFSLRLHGDDVAEGQTAWIYNSAAGRYATFEFSVRPSDGYAFSKVNVLLENGIAVGTYTQFAEDGTDLGDRAFVWVTGRGAYDLGSVLNVDPEAVGWDYLASGIVVNESGVIAGHGVPFDSTSQGVFLARLD